MQTIKIPASAFPPRPCLRRSRSFNADEEALSNSSQLNESKCESHVTFTDTAKVSVNQQGKTKVN
jgi:hypothetical protein